MDPIIKTPRISPASFSLNFRGGNARQKSQQPTTLNEETRLEKPPIPESPVPTPRPSHESRVQTSAYKPPQSESPALSPQLAADTTKHLIADSEQQRQKISFEKERESARQEGLEEGRKAAKKELEQGLAQISELLNSLGDLRTSLLAEMEDSAVEVVFEAVTKIIGQAAADRKIALNITHEAIEQARGKSQLTIRVAHSDFEIVQAALAQAGVTELSSKEVHVIPDNIVQLGGCVIETEAGSLDARLEIKLQRLKDTLLGVRKSGQDA